MNTGAASLDSFDPAGRRAALEAAARDACATAPCGNVNMHLHSFASFNALGWSPVHVALEARRQGLYAAALCDFDVLDGMDEFLSAGRLLGLRAAVHLETRAHLRELAEVDINSPGEHGVVYMMGAGFVREPEPGSAAAATLEGFRLQARRRNEELVVRVNAALPQIAVDYERDVLPLTPGGNATERHIVRAYVAAAERAFPVASDRARFWAGVLAADAARVIAADPAALEEQVRARLAKRGGLGYVAPTERTFPPLDDFVRWVADCRAIAMFAFLDGTGGGERDPARLLEAMTGKGVAAVNIIPDRNWNLKKPEEAADRRARLAAFIATAERMRLPINIGTEMNRLGQPFVDDLAGPALAAYAESFRRGARIMVGHSILLRFANLSYLDEPASLLFEQAGGLPPLEEPTAQALAALGPDRALARIHDSAAVGRWL